MPLLLGKFSTAQEIHFLEMGRVYWLWSQDKIQKMLELKNILWNQGYMIDLVYQFINCTMQFFWWRSYWELELLVVTHIYSESGTLRIANLSLYFSNFIWGILERWLRAITLQLISWLSAGTCYMHVGKLTRLSSINNLMEIGQLTY